MRRRGGHDLLSKPAFQGGGLPFSLDIPAGVSILSTAADLNSKTKNELASAAKQLGVVGAGSMKKEELVAALVKLSKAKPSAGGEKAGRDASAGRSEPAKSSKVNSKSVAKKATSAKEAASQKSAADKKTVVKAEPKSKSTEGKSGKADAKTTASSPKPAVAKSNPKSAAKSSSKQGSKSSSKPAIKLDAKPDRSESGKKSAKTIAAAAEAQTDSKKKSDAKSVAKPTISKKTAAVPLKSVAKPVPKPTTTSSKVLKKIRELQLQREAEKDIAFRPTLVRPPGAAEPIWEKEPLKDRIGLFVRDPYWLHASWDITRNAVERARAAMAEQWHGSKPVLRLLKLDDTGTSSSAETVERDIEIHGGLRNWYIAWTGEATSFRVLVGYLSASGRFHAIAKSNIVKTTAGGAPDAVDEHWSDVGAESERIFALSGGYDGEHETGELKEILEERVHRSLGAPALAKLGAGPESPFRRRGEFHFDMEIELVVYGSTVSDGYLTLNGEPVTLRPDGTFAVRLPFPDRRQVLPAVACTRDGSQQRTIVVAVERNTKIMEPLEQERDTGD